MLSGKMPPKLANQEQVPKPSGCRQESVFYVAQQKRGGYASQCRKLVVLTSSEAA